jgi:glutathione S-transferase
LSEPDGIGRSDEEGSVMRLHYSYASPYVRKVMAVAIETGQKEKLELTARKLTPVAPDADVNRDNPLGKVPCLVTDEGQALFDSRVICEYLDSLHGGKMFPAAGPARWTALRRQGEGDGILDAGVLARYETILRPEARSRYPFEDDTFG